MGRLGGRKGLTEKQYIILMIIISILPNLQTALDVVMVYNVETRKCVARYFKATCKISFKKTYLATLITT